MSGWLLVKWVSLFLFFCLSVHEESAAPWLARCSPRAAESRQLARKESLVVHRLCGDTQHTRYIRYAVAWSIPMGASFPVASSIDVATAIRCWAARTSRDVVPPHIASYVQHRVSERTSAQQQHNCNVPAAKAALNASSHVTIACASATARGAVLELIWCFHHRASHKYSAFNVSGNPSGLHVFFKSHVTLSYTRSRKDPGV